ncbi:MAG: RusA family crossover junction endodeoxyribonuclease [Ruminococcus sp.]|nr:RusA family crossover junction endodeoxyribonuclease [Ruminococcus sp.]
MYKFTIYGEPKGKQRHRANGRVMYTPTQTREYQRQVVQAYKAQYNGVYFNKGVPLGVKIKAVYKIPQSASKKKQAQMLEGTILPTKKPDYDNIAKIITDALNGVAFYDDAQVVYSSQLKVYGAIPRVEVTIGKINRINEGE